MIRTLFPPDRQSALFRDVATVITNQRNLNPIRERTYKRVVKRARHNSYPVKRPADKGIRHDRPAVIELANQRFIAQHNQNTQVTALKTTS